jgi:isoleucyl-tRNA synthetase
VNRSICLTGQRPGLSDELLVKDMSTVRELITKGLSERAEAKIKVRQPLRMVEIRHKDAEKLRRFEDILNEELNVKFTLFNSETSDQNDNPDEYTIEVNTEIDEELKSEGLMREVVRLVQNARKQAGLQVDDRIKLNISTENMEIAGAIEQFKKEIADETLAVSLAVSGSHTYSHITTAQIEKSEIAIAIAIDEAQ